MVDWGGEAKSGGGIGFRDGEGGMRGRLRSGSCGYGGGGKRDSG